MENQKSLRRLLRGKKVLYVATKTKGYIRLNQEINLVKEEADSYTILVSDKSNYILRSIEIYRKLLQISSSKYDIVFWGFMPQIVLPVFWRKFKNNTIITDFFISIYDTLIFDRKRVKEKTLVAKILKKIDQVTVKKSDYIISDTKAHAQYFCTEFGAKQERIFVLYLEADRSIYYPMRIKKKKNFLNKFIVLYFGSILPVQGVDVVMGAISRLCSNKNIHFIIVGPIGKKVKKINSDTVTYIDWLEQKVLAKYIAMSDLCLGGHFSDDVNKANRTIPGKVYIYRAMDKKVILGDSDANRELFSENDKEVFFVKRGSAEALSKMIVKIWKDSKADETFN